MTDEFKPGDVVAISSTSSFSKYSIWLVIGNSEEHLNCKAKYSFVLLHTYDEDMDYSGRLKDMDWMEGTSLQYKKMRNIDINKLLFSLGEEIRKQIDAEVRNG